MRILQVVQRFPPAIGGGEEVVYQISKQLVKNGHEVTVATSNWLLDDEVPGFSSSRVNLRGTGSPLPSHEIDHGVKIYRFKPEFRLWTYTLNPSMAGFLRKNVRHFDVVNAHYYLFMESALTAFFSQLESIPFVLTLHSSFSIPEVYPSFYRWGKKLYDATVGAFILESADRIVAVSPRIKDELLEFGVSVEDVAVVPNGIDFDRFKGIQARDAEKCAGRREKVVLFVGRLERQKGPQYLVEAIPEIRKEFPETRFVFVGEDRGYYGELKTLCEDLGVADRCEFTGRTEGAHLARLYAEADAFVLPAVGEGFGLAALESTYCGVPTILADSDALKHVLHEFGGYPLDMASDVPAQIAHYVKRAFLNGFDRAHLLESRRKIENEYCWQSVVQKLEGVYREVAMQ
jgi:glycosyltransferase involved in cell wall biosynthesis